MRVIVEEDEAGLFVATNPALPGCYSQGKSMEEALTKSATVNVLPNFQEL